MSSDFKASEYVNSKVTNNDLDSDEVPQEVAGIISASEVSAPEIQTWNLHDLSSDVDVKAQAREREIYSEIEKKLQPEINRQTEILKKEAYEEAKKAGFDAGYNDGKKLGEQEAKDIALAEAETKLAEKIASLEGLMVSLNAPYKLIEMQVFEHLSSLALHIAEEVIQQQITDKPEWIMQTIHQAIEVLNDDLSPLEILLNPDDFALIESIKTGFSEHWSVKPSEKISLGTCQVKQNFSSIEHNWKNRFESMSVKLEAQAIAEKAD
ncbi:MAG: hypothetical protein JXK16_01575 [Thiotrichales bacterium]|nr:hypothetical protein [Thiotrichales bacterium]